MNQPTVKEPRRDKRWVTSRQPLRQLKQTQRQQSGERLKLCVYISRSFPLVYDVQHGRIIFYFGVPRYRRLCRNFRTGRATKHPMVPRFYWVSLSLQSMEVTHVRIPIPKKIEWSTCFGFASCVPLPSSSFLVSRIFLTRPPIKESFEQMLCKVKTNT